MIYYIITLFVFIIYKPIYSIFSNEMVKVIPLLMLGIGIFRYSMFRKYKIYVGSKLKSWSSLSYLAFIVVFALSVLRKSGDGATLVGNINQAIQYCLLVFFSYAFILYQFRAHERYEYDSVVSRTTLAIISVPGLFVILDTFFYSLGFTGEKTDLKGHKSVFSSLLGLDLDRTHFYLGGHHNNFAMTVGALMALVTLGIIFGSYKRKFNVWLWIIVIFGVFCLLLADVRGAIASIIVSVVIVVVVTKLRATRILPVLILLPFIFTFLTSPLLSFLSSFGDIFLSSLSRGEGELLTFNNRIYIWEACLEEITTFKIEHLVGYGQAGHAASGIEDRWAWILPGRVTHNIYLQSFLDFGYIGLILLITSVLFSLRDSIWMYNRGIKEGAIFIGFLLYFCYAGFSEVSIGLYNHPFTSIFLLLLLMPIIYKNFYKAKL